MQCRGFKPINVQVLGITNYTHWKDTELLRRCMFGAPKAQMQIQQLALQKLQDFAHVGVMERLEDSIRSLAAAMGLKMRGPAWKVSCYCCEKFPSISQIVRERPLGRKWH